MNIRQCSSGTQWLYPLFLGENELLVSMESWNWESRTKPSEQGQEPSCLQKYCELVANFSQTLLRPLSSCKSHSVFISDRVFISLSHRANTSVTSGNPVLVGSLPPVQANSSGTNGNPLLVGSLTPVQNLPALSGSSSLRTLLEGRT